MASITDGLVGYTIKLIIADTVHRKLRKELLLRSPLGVVNLIESKLLSQTKLQYSTLSPKLKRFVSHALKIIHRQRRSPRKLTVRRFLVRNLDRLSEFYAIAEFENASPTVRPDANSRVQAVYETENHTTR